MQRSFRAAARVSVMLFAAVLSSCDNHRGTDGPDQLVLLSISAPSAAAGGQPILIYSNGALTLSPATDVGINATLRFKFGGPVDPQSLPADGAATGGSIRIATTGGAIANGRWSIDANDPTVVNFDSDYSTVSGCNASFQGDLEYAIDVLGRDFAPGTTIRIGGADLPATVHAGFRTIVCDPQNPLAAFVAPIVPLTITNTQPAMNASAPTVLPSAISNGASGSRIVLDCSQPLIPGTVTPSALDLYDVSVNPAVQIPIGFLLSFIQAGTAPGASPLLSQIVIDTVTALPPGDVYEIRTNASPIVAYGGQVLVIPAGQLRFRVTDTGLRQDYLFVDDFTQTSNLGTTNGLIAWTGDGSVHAILPSFLSNGADGVGTFAANQSINTNPNSGRFNFTTLTVNANVTLTLTSGTNDPASATSNYAARFAATGNITLGTSAVIDGKGNAGTAGIANTQTPGFGGWGGPGGGAGGNGSPDPSPTAHDSGGGPGQGAKFESTVNTGQFASRFGGGGGGVSGPLGNLGPSGGGGGQASHASGRTATAGEPQSGIGAPTGGAAGPLPSEFIPPLTLGTMPPGGSGGGAGGDRIDSQATPLTDDRGGAGGGGGGAILFSSGGTLTIGNFVVIKVPGGNGGAGVGVFSAKGAGGSGGTILLIAANDVAIAVGTQMNADNGVGSNGSPTLANDGDGGNGGEGLIQVMDADGVIPGLAQGIQVGETFVQAFQLTNGGLTGTAVSQLIDTGSTATVYQTQNSLGPSDAIFNIPTVGSISVTVTGIAEDPNFPGNPALATPSLISAPTALADIANLSGYRYFRFTITTTYPQSAATGAILPACDAVRIAYRR